MRAQLVAQLLGGFVCGSIQPRIMLTQPARAAPPPSDRSLTEWVAPKALTSLEHAHAFSVSIFGGVEHLRADGGEEPGSGH